MIDLAVFEQEMTILLDWFNRDLEQPTLKRLYQCLSQQLTTEQFIQAAQIVFQSCRFFPTVTEFVSAVKGDPETQALHEWEVCIKAAARNERDAIAQLSSQGQSALQLVGGLYKLGMSTEADLRWLKQEFVSAWKAIPAHARSLSPTLANDLQPSAMLPEVSHKMILNASTQSR